MDLLARREHGRAELERKLIAAGFDADVAADALQQLSEEGLQSDRRFVESFVQSRINQGKGPLRIQADLGQRGVASGLIDDVLKAIGEDWYALARDARLKKFGRSRPAEFRDKARQMRFLQYRGFEPDQIRAAVASFDD
jgi:regulatory protein